MPAPRITGHIRVRVGSLCIERRLLAFLQVRCQETDLNFPKFLAALIEREQRGFHEFLRRLIDQEQNECVTSGWKPSPPAPIAPKCTSEEGTEIDGPPRRDALTDDDRSRVVIALLDGETKIGSVAQRFGRGESTIRRIWKARAPSPETIQKIIFLHGRSGDEHMGIEAIAKAVGVNETIARAVIENYKPLVKETSAVYGRPPKKPGGWNRYAS